MDLIFLSKTPLFFGISPDEIQEMLGCLGGKCQKYQKGELIYRAGDTTTTMGILLSGSVTIEKDDFWGNRSILGHVAPGQIFAETYASIPGQPLMVSAVATRPSEVLLLDVARILHTCPTVCSHHSKLIHNLLAVTAQKNLNLSRRIFHTSPKSIRSRLISYLSEQANLQNNHKFTIPFNRQQLADYLNVDRSALSNELSKMQKDGLLTVSKNTFIINVVQTEFTETL